MGKVFEVGKMYYREESGFDPQKVIRRTDKTITCVNVAYDLKPKEFRQLIHVDEDGTEWVWDSYVPPRHRGSTVCKASWEVTE
jgi:hypothetical protein